jgi:hypothetical protein
MHVEHAPVAAQALLAGVAADPWGQVAVSLYDTARLVALAPWLAGHQSRIAFLCRQQRPDGGWGGPDGYALVPTLSATTALLTELGRGDPYDAALRRAVRGGLAALRRWLRPGSGFAVPDTIGVELIVPMLLDDLEPQLHRADTDLTGGATAALPLPAGFDRRAWEAIQASFARGALPQKAWACLEVFGSSATAAAPVRPAMGSVGCSAAATAAWLGRPDRDRAALRFLTSLQERGGGPVPGVSPITYFEAAWVLNNLATGGLQSAVPEVILNRLETGLSADGAPAAPGLPPDADDTAAVLSALLRHGRVREPASLLPYRQGDYFACFVGERNPSVSTNAHVLETLSLYLADRPAERSRYAGPAALAAGWLLGQQRPDGSWEDKWHASAHYATACCALALSRHGGADGQEAIRRAIGWVLECRRPDGSWGRWEGTVEETSYAVQVLSLAGPAHPDRPAAVAAIRHAIGFLSDPRPVVDYPPLWHAKDLYAPLSVVRAAQLGALYLGHRATSADRVSLGSR